MVHIIESKNIGEAWIRCMQKILRKGIFIHGKDVPLKEIINVLIKVKDPLAKDGILKRFADPAKIKWMKKNFFGEQKLPQYGYNYQQRLFQYNGINQIRQVITILRKNPEAKSATITLTRPGYDRKHVPCLVAMDFKIRSNRLIVHSFFRSQDIYNKMYADALQIVKLQQKVARELGKRIGSLCLHVISAHIYKDDLSAAKKVLKRQEGK